MYMVTYIARVWINRVRLPILLVASTTGKMNIPLSAFAPENLVLRDGFGSPVPRQPTHLHTLAESILPIPAAAFIYLFKTTIICHRRVTPEFIGARNCVPMAFTAESPPAQTGPINLKVIPNECCALAGHHGSINMCLSFPHPLLI